jgi:hypothetical protein
MKVILSTLKKILFWSYDRGTWQYDVMCVLILAFVLFAPNSAFHSHRPTPLIVRSSEIGQVDPTNLERELADRLERKYGHAVKISRIERVEESSGEISYIVYQK